jgi:hypothetical protein
MKGVMAMGAAVAAMPYLASLAGSASTGPSAVAPAQQAQASATTKAAASQSSNIGATASSDAETLVLIIKNDVISGFKGFQKMKLNDAQLASTLKSSFNGRFR